MSFRITMPVVEQTRLPRYRPRGRVPLFDYMRNYFNDRIGREVYRDQLMDFFVGNGYNENTVDTYRSYFTRAGYLMIVDRGEYHILKEIPHGMILADLRWEADRKNKKLPIKKMLAKPAKAFLSESEMMI
jgi:hypothetical protein